MKAYHIFSVLTAYGNGTLKSAKPWLTGLIAFEMHFVAMR